MGRALPRRGIHTIAGGMAMNCSCDPLAFTTAVNTLAAAISAQLNDDDLALAAAVLTQLGDTLATIAAQRQRCGREDQAV